MELHQETAPGRDLRYGTVVVGLTAVQLAPPAIAKQVAYKGIYVKSHPANTHPIYVGSQKTVRADYSASGGFPIGPGESVAIPVDDPSVIWLISGDADQYLSWMCV